MNNAAESFDILATNLSIFNYFDNSTKNYFSDLYSAKILDLPTK